VIPKTIFEQTIMQFLAPVRQYLEDQSVTEIMINGYDTIFIERGGRVERADAAFPSEDALYQALRNTAQFVGRHFNAEQPVLEARLPDGSRVEAVIPPAAPDGPIVAIRRFYRDPLTIARLVEFGALTADAAQTLAVLVACKQNVIVSGGTASGKTSLLNALSSFIDEGERVIVIEDARELQLQQPHVVNLEAQPANERGRGEVSVRRLFQATLRLRPDRIVVGEIRGGEALDLVQAMTSGHGGCLSTVHATHPLDTVTRIETMALMSDVALPLHALRAQVASAVDIIVHTSRLADGSRRITHISEVVGQDGNGYHIRDLFVRSNYERDHEGRIHSVLEPTGVLPTAANYVRAMGYELPGAVLAAARARRRP
jgi:pilus assembly protein CpaF